MGFFKNLFGSRHTKLETADPELGHFNSDYIKGSDVTWIGKAQLFGKTTELLIDGDQERISPIQKKIVMSALKDEENLRIESSKAIKEEFKNAELEFTALEEELEIMAISSNDNGFELSFEQKKDPYYYFNVLFENNKSIGVSIDS